MLHPQPHTGSDSELDDSMQTNDNDNTEDNDDKGIEDSPNSRWTSNEVETLKFYPCGWWVITRAKQYWCLYIATQNPFSNCTEHLSDAAVLLTRAIKEYRKEDGMYTWIWFILTLFSKFFDIDCHKSCMYRIS